MDVGHPDRWSLEVALPLADLGLPAPEVPLRLALVVRTRVPAHVAWAPPGAAWLGPASWTRLVSADPWPQADVDVDGDALAEADRLDDDRLYAWATFVGRLPGADRRPPPGRRAHGRSERPRRQGRSARRAAPAARRAPRADPRAASGPRLRARRARRRAPPDGARRRGAGAFDRALELMPGLGEARFGIHLELVGPSLAVGPVGGPTDYRRRLRGRRRRRGARGVRRRGRRLRHGAAPPRPRRLRRGPRAPRSRWRPATPSSSRSSTPRRARASGSSAGRARSATASSRRSRTTCPRVRLTTSKGDDPPRAVRGRRRATP